MIQELVRGGGGGGVGGLMEERKIITPTVPLLLEGHSSPSSTSITPLSSSTTSSPSSSAAVDNQNNLKCPRCDSSNTKFCYYNNYNLTQPRHFCKTCRRYWTKGGTLRNVPIGGGCRKSKSNGGSSIGVTTCKNINGGIKAKTNGFYDSMTTGIKPNFLGGGGGDHVFGSNEFSHGRPFLYASSSHSSNLLSLLRDHHTNTNSNPNLNFVRIKDDFSHLVPDATLVTNALNSRLHGFDHNFSHVPISNSIVLKNNHYQHHHHHHQQQQQIQQQNSNYNNMLFGTEVQGPSAGIQELYQRLRSSNNNYADQQCQVILGNLGFSPSTSSSSPPPSLLPIPLSVAASTTTATITATTSANPAASTTAMDQFPIGSSGYFGMGWNLPTTWSDHMPTN